MKSYTNIPQSKKLAEILPIESADMRYAPLGDTHPWFIEGDLIEADAVPCWSLAALIDILPCDWWGYNKHYFLEISKMGDMSAPYYVSYFRFREQSDGANFGRIVHISFQSDNPIDACYEMIIKLNELNLL